MLRTEHELNVITLITTIRETAQQVLLMGIPKSPKQVSRGFHRAWDLSLRGFPCPWGELTVLTSKKPILTEAAELNFLNNKVMSKRADGSLRLENPSPLGESGDCNFSMT